MEIQKQKWTETTMLSLQLCSGTHSASPGLDGAASAQALMGKGGNDTLGVLLDIHWHTLALCQYFTMDPCPGESTGL